MFVVGLYFSIFLYIELYFYIIVDVSDRYKVGDIEFDGY